MNSEGIMRGARRLYLASLLALIVPAVFAQSPPASNRDELDVTMHVIVDPDAKLPDEIVRRIPLPKPAQPAQPATGTDTTKPGKPSEPGAPGQQRGTDAREKGREFGQQVSEDAKQRSEEARNNNKKPPPERPGRPPPPSPPGRPPSPGG
ncbi:MAG TPA: hypothetical protein VIV63_04755 [Steroidobacteraceae bacterium]